MINIELTHVPQGRHKIIGPYSWVEITYDKCRLFGKSKDEEDAVIIYVGGLWVDEEDSLWTDIIISDVND